MPVNHTELERIDDIGRQGDAVRDIIHELHRMTCIDTINDIELLVMEGSRVKNDEFRQRVKAIIKAHAGKVTKFQKDLIKASDLEFELRIRGIAELRQGLRPTMDEVKANAQ